MQNTNAYINGRWYETGSTFPVFSPLDGKVLDHVSSCSDTDVDYAIESAQNAQKLWALKSSEERANILLDWEKKVQRIQCKLAEVLHREQGKIKPEAEGEVTHARSLIRWAASEGLRIYGKDLGIHNGHRHIISKRPVGVVGAITPWNFPVASIVVKAASALAAGCSIIIKPSELTPLTALLLAQTVHESDIPAGVVNIIPAEKAETIGDMLCTDERINMLSFTGSSKVGKMLMTKCAPFLKKVSLELGGNAPFLVLDNANMEQVISSAISSKFYNSGQACVAANRFLIHKNRLNEFVEKLMSEVEKISHIQRDHNGTLGPLTQHTAPERLDTLVSDAISMGAEELTRTSQFNNMQYYSPRVITHVNPNSMISQQEIFGPVVAIQSFEDCMQGLELANKTNAGLAAYLFGANTLETSLLADKLNFGMIGCNSSNIFAPSLGFRGIKESGCGVEGGINSLEDYLEERNISQRYS